MTADEDGKSLQERRTVHVVDDDPALLHSLKFALELEGYAVTAYRTADEVLAAPAFRIGCLVVDYVLPDMDGIALIEALRGRGVSIPAILITTNPPPALLMRASAFDTRVIEKPLLTNTLSEAIKASFAAGV